LSITLLDCDCLGTDIHWQTDTVLEQDQSGWIKWLALDQRLIFSTVDTMAGVYTTVVTTRTFQSVATTMVLQQQQQEE